jgi:hypothetical protein
MRMRNHKFNNLLKIGFNNCPLQNSLVKQLRVGALNKIGLGLHPLIQATSNLRAVLNQEIQLKVGCLIRDLKLAFN